MSNRISKYPTIHLITERKKGGRKEGGRNLEGRKTNVSPSVYICSLGDKMEFFSGDYLKRVEHCQGFAFLLVSFFFFFSVWSKKVDVDFEPCMPGDYLSGQKGRWKAQCSLGIGSETYTVFPVYTLIVGGEASKAFVVAVNYPLTVGNQSIRGNVYHTLKYCNRYWPFCCRVK